MKQLLIRELQEIYPYSRAWFQKLSISALIALTHKRVNTRETIKKPTQAKIKYENGDYYVLTYSGWEVMCI